VIVCDGGTPSLCDTGRIIINVLPVNDPPNVPDSTVTIPEDSIVTVCVPVTDVDGPSILTSSCGGPSNGTASPFSVSGNSVCVTYTPDTGFTGTDTICIIVCDGGNPSLCDTSKIIINVVCKTPAQPDVTLSQPGCGGSNGTITVTSPLRSDYSY
jgi:hypothetical protein